MRSILTICLLSIGFLVYGQDVETRDVKKFYDISVQGPFKVELRQGKAGEIKISSDRIPMDEIITDVSGNELNIKLKTRAYLKDDYYDDMDYIKVTLNYDELEAHFLGYDQSFNKKHQVYMNMLLDSLKLGISEQVDRIVFARTAMEIKSTIGAIPEDLYCYIRANNKLMNYIMPTILEYFRPADDWVQRKPFKDYPAS